MSYTIPPVPGPGHTLISVSEGIKYGFYGYMNISGALHPSSVLSCSVSSNPSLILHSSLHHAGLDSQKLTDLTFQCSICSVLLQLSLLPGFQQPPPQYS